MAMETIWDHEPTDAELADLLAVPVSKREYLAMPINQQSEFAAIFRLYSLREDEKTAKAYLEKVTDEEVKQNLLNVDTF